MACWISRNSIKNMKTNVSEYDFCRAFEESEERKNQFSHSALKALYDYIIDLEESCDAEIEFDMVALCCDYTEYGSAWEAMEQYQSEDMPTIDDSEGMDLVELGEAQEAAALEWLEERTTVIPFDGTVTLSDGTVLGDRGVIIQQF